METDGEGLEERKGRVEGARIECRSNCGEQREGATAFNVAVELLHGTQRRLVSLSLSQLTASFERENVDMRERETARHESGRYTVHVWEWYGIRSELDPYQAIKYGFPVMMVMSVSRSCLEAQNIL